MGALLCVAALPALAQDGEGHVGVDPSALGIDLFRVRRGVQAEERMTQNGLNLDVFITVFGEAPPLLFLPQGDPNEPFFIGPPADGPPTHADLQRIRTPREFSASVMDFGAAFQWLRNQLRSENSR
jgi:hypothetical protein